MATAEELHQQGLAAFQQKQHQVAATLFEQSIKLEPNNGQFLFNYGLALVKLHHYQEAIAALTTSIDLVPNHAPSFLVRGKTLHKLGRFDEAKSDYQTALSLSPHNVEALANLGVNQQLCGDFHDAADSYRKALNIKPVAEIYFNRALLLLKLGQFAEGWALHEQRWQMKGEFARHSTAPLWLGAEALDGKAICLHSEQGIGDSIQFFRYVSLVKKLGATVLMETDASLTRLFSATQSVDEFLLPGQGFAAHYQCPLMSLPLAFKTFSEAEIPNQPYLQAPDELVAKWAEKFANSVVMPRVGLVWHGKPSLVANQRRNIPFALLAQLNRPDINFFSLQKGEPAESELPQQKQQFWQGDNFHHFMDEVTDFADTAAIIQHLDLVIAVDTSTAHLAGAMGKPVWLLNRFDSCWRWGVHRTDSPWYPSMRIFNQPTLGDWQRVIDEVKQALGEWRQGRQERQG